MQSVEYWFVTGSQHLYGPETLAQVAKNSEEIARGLGLVFKPVLTDPEAISKLMAEANADPSCAGLVLWMHTFSPAKMWIRGLSALKKPVCHLHTQFNVDLPWASIDMDFMNLNQAAHGDREAGHLHTRLGLKRKVIVGHWASDRVNLELSAWTRMASGWQDLQGAKFARLGDNMRYVSVTEGDKVSAEIQFGFAVNGYGLGDLSVYFDAVSESEIQGTIDEYRSEYVISDAVLLHPSLRDAARQELALRGFLKAGNFKGFTTTFEDLHGLNQLPGLACQRLMADGYGFGAEGDWKTAAMLRFAKQVTKGQSGGTSFMEDYTYHLAEGREQVLGAHMLEICPSISKEKPRLEIHPLGIGGKNDPARLVFDAKKGPALNASLVDLGHRFRLIVNMVNAIDIPSMPNLPVARALWEVEPSFEDGVAAWIYAGGAHHTVYSYDLSVEQLRGFAEIAGIEIVVIDQDTKLSSFRNELRWNEVAYRA